jgi:predicted amidohydrolase
MDEWKTYLRSRAYENAVFMVGANRVGEDVTMVFGGESMVVGPRGQIYASLAGETDATSGAPLEGFAVARINLDEIRQNREEYQQMQNRQPTVYKAIVRRY